MDAEVDTWDPHGGMKEQSFASCPLASLDIPWQKHFHTYTDTHKINKIKISNINFKTHTPLGIVIHTCNSKKTVSSLLQREVGGGRWMGWGWGRGGGIFETSSTVRM